MMYLLLIVGFVILIKGADIFVEGSSNIAKAMRIPSLIIGLTIVSMGTSAPEASVSITAALAGSNEIALSNILGSNIFNLMFVVGVCAVLKPAKTDKALLKRDFPIAVISSLAVLYFIFDKEISRTEGISLIFCMVVYLIAVVGSAVKRRTTKEEATAEKVSVLKSILFMVGGLAAVIFGGNMVVDNSIKIASALGLSETFIGLTIVAIGTSLPELATSVVAARKGDSGLSLGNAIGSNIFNVFFILGLSAALSPISVVSESLIDAVILLVITIIMFVFCATHKKADRREGIICLLIYLAYMIYVVLR